MFRAEIIERGKDTLDEFHLAKVEETFLTILSWLMCASALADFSASRLAVKVTGCGNFWCDADWLTGNLPTYFKPFVDDATDDEEDVDEFEGSGMLVVVVVDEEDGGPVDVIIRPFAVEVDVAWCWK